MAKAGLTQAEQQCIARLVDHYKTNQDRFFQFLEQLRGLFLGEKPLTKHIHSIKWRLKDPEHLRRKLSQKLKDSKNMNRALAINEKNLFYKINDLVGVRILHLHTKEMEQIDQVIKALFSQQRYQILKGPIAKTWDDESRNYFSSIGIKTEKSPSMYTSVHYEVQESSRRKYTFELQIRTLMEEVWGEVSHALNYPEPTLSLACREQLQVLARATSTCTRLVDSIFKTHAEGERATPHKEAGGDLALYIASPAGFLTDSSLPPLQKVCVRPDYDLFEGALASYLCLKEVFPLRFISQE